MWQNSIAQAPDTLRGGAPYSCLAGKVYLFGSEASHPLMGEGRPSMRGRPRPACSTASGRARRAAWAPPQRARSIAEK